MERSHVRIKYEGIGYISALGVFVSLKGIQAYTASTLQSVSTVEYRNENKINRDSHHAAQLTVIVC